jgi:hypothetical protein
LPWWRYRNVTAGRAGRGFRRGEIGFRTFHGELIIARVELDEHVPGLHRLVVRDFDRDDGATDAGRDRAHMSAHLRVVRALTWSERTPADVAAGGEYRRHAQHDEPAAGFAVV